MRYLEIIIATIIILFCIALYALTIQAFGIESNDRATIISGVLSMVGGSIGALGAYFVATYQMKKQFKKHDNDRVLEMKINKLTETLGIAYEFAHELHIWYGLINSIKINTTKHIESHTHINESDIFDQCDANHLFNKIREIVYFKDTLKKNYIYFVNAIELQEIYDSTSNVVEINKEFLALFEEFNKKDSIQVNDIKEDFSKISIEVGGYYNQLDNSITKLIAALEDEINKLFGESLY